MQYQRFDHTMLLNMTSQMRDDIDKALVLEQGSLVRTRSEFLRMACQSALDSILAGACGDVPLSLEERKRRVLSGADVVGADRSDPVQPDIDNEYPRPRCA